MRYIKGCIPIFKRIALIVSCAAVALAASCSAVSVAGYEQQIAMYTLPPVSEVPAPAPGGELSFPVLLNPSTLNPLKIDHVEWLNLFSLVFEQPVRIMPDGTPGPELAETWEVDETGKEWTFHLREGVKWQDGSDFTSADVVYTAGLIKGYTAGESMYSRHGGEIAGLSADGDYTVKVRLSRPGNLAIYFMTFPVLCKSYCEGKDINSLKPVGTGPYKIESFDKMNRIELKYNELWWKKPPYIQSLTAICYADHPTELAAFDSSLVNFLTTSSLTVDTHKKYGYTKSIDYQTNFYNCLVPNMRAGLFSDADMRKGLSLALDKREIVSKALLGHAVACDYPVAPDSFLIGGPSTLYKYNLTEAVSLFEKAGWKDRDGDGMLERVEGTRLLDLNVKLLIKEDKENTERKDVAENIAAQLRNCGVGVEIAEEPKNMYEQDLRSGNFEIALCEFYFDQDPDVSFMLRSGADSNFGGFSDEGFDAILDEASSATGAEEMKAAYLKLQEAFSDAAPQISLYFRTNTLLYDASINVVGSLREMNVFSTIPQWYLYTTHTGEKDDNER